MFKCNNLNLKNIQLSRKIKKLTKKNILLNEENKKLMYINEEQENTIIEIRKIILERGQGTIIDRFDKIKNLVCNDK